VTPSSDSKKPKRTGKGATEHGRSERDRSSPRPTRETGGEERGILSNLPSTRPQRPSARRAAAKRAAAAASKPAQATRSTTAKGRSARSATMKATDPAPQPTGDVAPTGAPIEPTGPSAQPKTKTAGRRRTTARRVKPTRAEHRSTPPPPPLSEPPVPPQGFEGEGEIEPGTPVQPPSRPEVAGALAELVGDLAQTGLARGGRLVKEALGRLPGI
jgi:hypothetical protein